MFLMVFLEIYKMCIKVVAVRCILQIIRTAVFCRKNEVLLQDSKIFNMKQEKNYLQLDFFFFQGVHSMISNYLLQIFTFSEQFLHGGKIACLLGSKFLFFASKETSSFILVCDKFVIRRAGKPSINSTNSAKKHSLQLGKSQGIQTKIHFVIS